MVQIVAQRPLGQRRLLETKYRSLVISGPLPSHHLISIYTNFGATGRADHMTLLRLFNLAMKILIWNLFPSGIGIYRSVWWISTSIGSIYGSLGGNVRV